jgi:hypothetical protein
MSFLLSNLWIFVLFVFAEPMQVHKAQMQTYDQKILEHEVRLKELLKNKEATKDGEHLEEILSEIADTHKELVNIKKKREDIRDHLRKAHSSEEAYSDLSFFKQTDLKKDKKQTADIVLDKKLDELLSLVQRQYVRTLSEDFKVSKELQTEEDVRKKLKEQRVKVNKSNKKKYIREELETTIKTE